MKTILNARQITEAVNKLSESIIADIPEGVDFALVGVRSRGEILAYRLTERISEKLCSDVQCGTLDITLYRDDINDPHSTSVPEVRSTEIDFDVDDKIIFLVDDVLHTGRSTRAALDALIDLGRPRAIRLAVLVDRLGREYPIQADYVGVKTQAEASSKVRVNFIETDQKDQVFIE